MKLPGKVTKGLFVETAYTPETVKYTLRGEGTEAHPSLRQLYLACDDPTEYDFAVKYLEGIDHWEELCACKWFQPYIESWRKELLLRLQSRALLRIREEAQSGGKNSLQANRYLIEKGWEPRGSTRGRPSKDEVRREAERQVNEVKQIADDFARIAVN